MERPMLAVAGGILIAILVLFLLPVILPLVGIALVAAVVLAAIALIVLTGTGQAVLGVIALGGVDGLPHEERRGFL